MVEFSIFDVVMQEIWPLIDQATYCRPLKITKSSKEKYNYGIFLINHCHIIQIHFNAKLAYCDVAIFSQTRHGQCNRYKRSCLRRRLLSGIVGRLKYSSVLENSAENWAPRES